MLCSEFHCRVGHKNGRILTQPARGLLPRMDAAVRTAAATALSHVHVHLFRLLLLQSAGGSGEAPQGAHLFGVGVQDPTEAKGQENLRSSVYSWAGEDVLDGEGTRSLEGLPPNVCV